MAQRSDELGALARAIEQMVEIMQKRDHEIAELKRQLAQQQERSEIR